MADQTQPAPGTPTPGAGEAARIHLLREEVSRKIAAGEVIDRPFSVLRELLDNALDAGAGNIEVHIQAGGLGRIRVVDDGRGMSGEDLALCARRHATSKIQEEADLARVSSLGFRGEALASIAACSRLEIVSLEVGGSYAHCLRLEGGRRIGLEEAQGGRGTLVDVSDLFFNLPARKKFLKSTAAETGACRQALLEKALPFPQVAFRLFIDGSFSSFLASQGLRERIAAAYGLQQEHLALLEAPGEGFCLRIAACRPEIVRGDRRLVQVYVNRRRIQEYALIQAVEYAYSPFLPGGSHPIAFVFIQIDPEQVDFNVHPAKREARFRNLPALHRGIVSLLQEHLRGFRLRPPAGDGAPAGQVAAEAEVAFPAAWLGKGGAVLAGAVQAPQGSRPVGQANSPVYHGQIFRLFLLVEYGESLYLIDQHAAHERLIYEKLKNRPPLSQELLMPIRLETGPLEEALIRERLELFRALGIGVQAVEEEGGVFEITALPEELLALGEEELKEAMLAAHRSPAQVEEELFRLAACRLAIKEGEAVDSLTARELVRGIFSLENARCPHGRPIWHRLGREELFRLVGRL